MESSLTADEREILEISADLWNKFLKLPIYHPMHQGEMCSIIHQAQRLVMSRVVTRQEDWFKVSQTGDKGGIHG